MRDDLKTLIHEIKENYHEKNLLIKKIICTEQEINHNLKSNIEFDIELKIEYISELIRCSDSIDYSIAQIKDKICNILDINFNNFDDRILKLDNIQAEELVKQLTVNKELFFKLYEIKERNIELMQTDLEGIMSEIYELETIQKLKLKY